jgi:hypothetical protein
MLDYEVSTKQTCWNRNAVHLDKRAILPTFRSGIVRAINSAPIGITVALQCVCVARAEAIESGVDMNTAGR